MHFASTCFKYNRTIASIMPPGFMHYGPPIEVIVTEFIYFLLVTILSLYIFFKTKEIYELTRHRGIYHFRNIFLYFAIAHMFRLMQVVIVFSSEIFGARPFPMIFQPLNFFLVSYFGTLAILSAVISAYTREINVKTNVLNLLLHSIALASSFLVVLIFSYPMLILLQTVTFLVALIMILVKSRKGPKLLSQNKITYVLLFIFWALSTLAFVRRLFPREVKIPLYLLSVGVFFSIFLRVRKRLVNGKKRPS